MNCGEEAGQTVMHSHIHLIPRRKGDTEKVVANCNKIKKILKWKPKYNSIEIILKSALEWEKKIYKKNFI